MKKLWGVALAIVLTLALSLPALAVDTGVTVTQGGGNAPVVKCKWETPDAIPGTYGTQVTPPCTYEGTKDVNIYVVVGDTEDNGVVLQVVADVYHPQTEPECGSRKFNNVELEMLGVSEGIAAYESAVAGNLVYYQSGYDYAETHEELVENVARVWMCTIVLDYCQPAGLYRVEVLAVDQHQNVSAPMINEFLYIPTACIEIDFTSVSYPDALMSSHVWTLGDTTFGTASQPTVRNIGNTDVQIQVWQNDMGFGTYADGEPKVEFDARLGPDPDGTNRVVYNPGVTTTLPGILPLCETMKLDFSIHIKFATPGSYSGLMTLSAVVVPFECCE